MTGRFLKPSEDGGGTYKEDKTDSDTVSSTNFVYNPFISQSIERQRQRLPIFKVRNHFLHLAENFQVILVIGDTGSGKSTQLPQYLLESNWSEDGVIGVAEPRRVACTSLAARVAEENNCLLGENVGFCIRFDDCTTEKTKIKYMTEGILVREMMIDPLLRQYSVIMIDEVHERTLYTDILLGLMKKILKRRTRLKLIVCSATFDAEKLFDFFNFKRESGKDNAVILSVPGRSYPVDLYYLNEPVPDYVKASVETAVKIHKNEAPGDVLIFLTGVEQVESCAQMIQDQLESSRKCDDFVVYPMYGSLTNQEQLKAFQNVQNGVRKFVVATNIAETSVTIPNIVYVIDCGMVKLRIFDVKTFCDSLIVVPISQASAIQRAGRAGRTRAGRVYRLYTEDTYSNFDAVTVAEMQRTNLSSAVLNLMALGIENMLRFDFPSPPPSGHLIAALNELFALEVLDSGGKLTSPLGTEMAELPLSPQMAKMLLVSGDYGCSEEILTIIAMLQVQNIFVLPKGAKRIEARVMHRQFQVAEGDLLTLLNVYDEFKAGSYSKNWCMEHFINYKALLRALEMRSRMQKMYSNFGHILNDAEGSIDPICRCITAGFFTNAAYLHRSGTYRTVRSSEPLYIHPTSVLYDQEQPQWILFTELLHTTKTYMKDITVIEENWLTEIAPHFYEKNQPSLRFHL